MFYIWHGTLTEDKPRIITKVIEGTCSDSKYTFTLAGRLSEPCDSDLHTVILSSPPTNLTCILDYIIEVALPGFIEKRRLRNLEDIDAFIIKITCTIPFPLNDTDIIVSEVKGTFTTDKEVLSYDLSNIEQINNKITCLKEEETESENNDDTQNENEEENQSGDKDDSQSGNKDDTKSGENDDSQSGDKDDTKNGDNDDSQSGSESNKEEDSGKIIQLSCYLFMFILFVI